MSDPRPPRDGTSARSPGRNPTRSEARNGPVPLARDPPRDDATTTEARLSDLAGGLALVVRSDSGSVAQTLHESRVFTLGRGVECDVVIHDHSVSRRHARVSFDAGWRVEDLGSRNGTVVDGRKLAPGERVPVRVGSVVSLGSATAVLQAGESSRFVPPPRSV